MGVYISHHGQIAGGQYGYEFTLKTLQENIFQSFRSFSFIIHFIVYVCIMSSVKKNKS